MVTPTPYGAGISQSSASISCFRSSPDADAALSFGRPFRIAVPESTIYASTTLPAGSREIVNASVGAITQDLTSSVDATGLFYCEGSNRGLTTRVYSIIHSVHRRLETVDGLVTKTVNKGENVTLTVTQVGSGGLPLWRRTRNGVLNYTYPDARQSSIKVPPRETVDGDLYTAVADPFDVSDNHFSMTRLIVRGCVAGKWGPPGCEKICNLCFNGGVCDDETGDCICPPGFSGPNCLTACGRHRFGWHCEHECGGPNDVIQSCSGSQFGLPDPYGNSCISGYSGRYCDTVCTSGSFGAGCTQTCHCQSGDCDPYTGECTNGCEFGWSGTSCQIPGDCPVGYYGVQCLSKCHCFDDEPCSRDSGLCSNGACALGLHCVSVPEACPAGFFGANCVRACHCLNTAACNENSQYCVGSDGECEPGFQSDVHINNCLFGITEFKVVAKTNPGQNVDFRCAASSFDTLPASSITLSTSPNGNGDTFRITSSATVNWVLVNTYSVPGLRTNESIYCILNYNMITTSMSLHVDFYALPQLSLPPSVTVASTSATCGCSEREGPGGEGPMCPATQFTLTLPELPPTLTTGGPAAMESATPSTQSTMESATSSTESTTRVKNLPPIAYTTSNIKAPTPPQPTPSGSSSIVLIVVIVVVVIVVIVVTVVSGICFLRHRRSRRKSAKTQSTGGQELVTYENEMFQPNDTSVTDYERVGHARPVSYDDVSVAPSPTYEDPGLPSWAQSWSIPLKNMIIGEKILGKGNFGEVRDGAVMVGGDISKAAIKTLKANASANDRLNFMEKFRTLTTVGQHPNVVSILGACQHEDNLYVAFEFMPNGDLRTYLRNARSLGDDDQSTLSSEKLIQFALDVAKGMQHLAALGIIHRDLAARNILLGSQLVAKVSDFGLSRGEDIYVQTSRTPVPTRWLSLESLTSKINTLKSDVWSFGILLWEIATLGATPYEDIKSKNLLSRLENGYRMSRPSNCDDEIYNLMLLCWQDDPANRPHFKKLVTRLTSMADSQNEHMYMRLLPKAENYMYLMIRPELDDN
ncbi:tyrosine-protein kinase receptor Tie-1-like [Patiria miniata]|uniref:receptor protein-tyrosine kinase n=1 Tax=Patiria miniata TaxID=46514 RepID=A0A914AT78_PATMI|nr:tyrosine-protein kinase receptor Tie-1-like [Patiria miniata]